MNSNTAAIAAIRFGMGARPGEIAAIGDDPRGWLAEQVLIPSTHQAVLDGLGPSHELVEQLLLARRTNNIPGIIALIRGPYRDQYIREAIARTGLAVSTPDGFHERWVRFWSDHFTVTGKKPAIAGLAGSFEREAIRPNVTGRFVDLLLAVVGHPVMLLYLDNARSFGPNTPAARYTDGGVNENLAREVLELHTLGVDGGYSQADVQALALMLTGWSLSRGDRDPVGGQFKFYEVAHEGGPQTLLGVTYPDGGVAQAEGALHDLARQPATATNVARELARHFVADTPDAATVDALARTFLDTDGDLIQLALAVLDIDAAWEPLTKLKTPDDLVVSSLRAIGADGANGGVLAAINELGQPPWMAPSPKGWADTARAWITPDRAMRRVDFAAATAARAISTIPDPTAFAYNAMGELCSRETMTAIVQAESATQAVALALSAPEFQRR